MTTKRVVGKCPVCDGPFRVARLVCTSCDAALEGSFELSNLCRLSREHQQFVEVFVASRGSIKEVEKVLGISYPTVRARLDDVIAALGYEVPAQASLSSAGDERRKKILEALDRGEMSAEDALNKLRQQGG